MPQRCPDPERVVRARKPRTRDRPGSQRSARVLPAPHAVPSERLSRSAWLRHMDPFPPTTTFSLPRSRCVLDARADAVPAGEGGVASHAGPVPLDCRDAAGRRARARVADADGQRDGLAAAPVSITAPGGGEGRGGVEAPGRPEKQKRGVPRDGARRPSSRVAAIRVTPPPPLPFRERRPARWMSNAGNNGTRTANRSTARSARP